MMGYAVDALDRFSRVLRFIGQLVLAFMVVTICYDVLMRYLFTQPTSWSLEVNTFLLIYVAVMTAADVQREKEHISISFLAAKFPPHVQGIVGAVVALVGVAFCAILAWRGGLMTYQAFEYGERVSSALGTPRALPYSMLPIGFGVLALQFLVQAIRSVTGKESSHA